MPTATQTYGKIATQTANPRELEADLLLKAASRLQEIRDAWDSKHADLDEALLYNRKLWSVFLSAVTSPDNPLPANVRQNVANLGVFVFSQTLETMSNPKPERLGALINVNRQIAAGLMGRAA